MTVESGAASAGRAASGTGGRQRSLSTSVNRWRHSLNGRFIALSVITNVARILAAIAVLLAVGDVRAAMAGDLGAATDLMILAAVDRIVIVLVLVIVLHAFTDIAAFRFGRDLVSRPVARILEATGPSSPDPAAPADGPRTDALTESLARFRTAREAADEVARLNDELLDQVRELDSFTYSVSHDLRAPLRAIDGFAKLLEEGPATRLDAQGHAYLATIRQNADRMNELIEGLLALSRIGRDAIRPELVEPNRLVQAVLDEGGILADPNVEVRLDPLPPCVADPMLLRQVYANLLGNAHKFSRDRRPARIHIGAEAGPGGEGDGDVRYFVRDNGAGFDDRHAHRLFGVFQRLHKADEFEGTGVGLAIAHRIIDRLGGRIWAHGEVGAGATLWFTLPGGAS